MQRIGYRMAQLGGLLMVAGGLLDLSIREMLPHHAALLAPDTGAVPAGSAALVLALLRALGGALVAAGVAVLTLLWFARRTGIRAGYIGAAAVALLAEGPNTLGIRETGSPLFVAPLAFLLLVVIGCAICLMAASGSRPGVSPAR